MRRIRLVDARPGMVLGRPVVDAQGKVLIHSGVKLRASYIKRLQAWGYESVYVRPEEQDFETPADTISDEVRYQAIGHVKSAFERVAVGKPLDMVEINQAVHRIIDELLAKRDVCIGLTDIRSHDSYTFGHSVNVCVMSLIIGMSIGMNQLELRELGLGAILHDVGKVMVPQEILTKPDKLTPEEWALIQEHPRAGFEILRKEEELTARAAHIAFQHHESFDGSGYPRGLKGTESLRNARIVAIADAYDAMTVDRVYRPALSITRALEELRRGRATRYDPFLLDHFFRRVAFYPHGAEVMLSTGARAVVVAVRLQKKDRPVVRIIRPGAGDNFIIGQFVDLAEEPGVAILSVVGEEEREEAKGGR